MSKKQAKKSAQKDPGKKDPGKKDPGKKAKGAKNEATGSGPAPTLPGAVAAEFQPVADGGGDASLSGRPAPSEPADATLALALRPGPVDLSALDTVGTEFGPQSAKDAEKALAKLGDRLATLQEKLYAQGISGDRRSVLLVLQGMDTAGKDGVIKHVLGLVNPAGVTLASFKKPTQEELDHDFLWRIEKRIPGAGQIGVFNRSQYEDVLVVRVHDLVPKTEWTRRYASINSFERRLARQGITVVKVFLHISSHVQKERLAARLDDPTKYWKYNPGDVDERAYWSDYQAAYADALRKCNTVSAPWSVVPSDRKWYRNWAVAALLTETLERLDPEYPPQQFDLEVEKARVAES